MGKRLKIYANSHIVIVQFSGGVYLLSVQDDRRESEQLELFELEVPDGRSRDGTDAILEINGQIIEFELKSTTKNSVTTVRDFGMNHIAKWENKHWLFGFYTPQGKALRYTRYASAKMMASWVEEKRSYIEADYLMSKVAPEKLQLSDLAQICGDKEFFSLDDAKKLHKKQFTAKEYLDRMDLEQGYSPSKMLEILQLRCEYIIQRGSTLNNPHIPASVLTTFPQITSDHGRQLRKLVSAELE